MKWKQLKSLAMHPSLKKLLLTGVFACIVLGGVFFIQLSFNGFTIFAWEVFLLDFACLLLLVNGSIGYVFSLYQQKLESRQLEENTIIHLAVPNEAETICDDQNKRRKRAYSLRLYRRTPVAKKRRYKRFSSCSHF